MFGFGRRDVFPDNAQAAYLLVHKAMLRVVDPDSRSALCDELWSKLEHGRQGILSKTLSVLMPDWSKHVAEQFVIPRDAERWSDLSVLSRNGIPAPGPFEEEEDEDMRDWLLAGVGLLGLFVLVRYQTRSREGGNTSTTNPREPIAPQRVRPPPPPVRVPVENAVLLLLLAAGAADLQERPDSVPGALVADWVKRSREFCVIGASKVAERKAVLDLAKADEDTGLLVATVETKVPLAELGNVGFKGAVAERLAAVGPFHVTYSSLQSTRGLETAFARTATGA